MMRKNIFVLFLAAILFYSVRTAAAFPQSVFKGNYQMKSGSNDSLIGVIESLNQELDNADSVMNAESIQMMLLKESVARKDSSLSKFERLVNTYKNENDRLNQSNKLLIVFNSLSAILLLLCIIYVMIRKNKSEKVNSKLSNTPPEYEIQASPSNHLPKQTGVEDRLIQIERLARLREGGLLTAIEFEKEKEKILRG